MDHNDDPQYCSNNQCGEEMFILGGVYVCEVCDLVANPANVGNDGETA